MKSFLLIASIVTMLSALLIENSIGKSEKCLVMPEELVNLARSIGCEQHSAFYSELGFIFGPPFVYGFNSQLKSENSVVFWCKDTSSTVSVFQENVLVFAERDNEWDSFQIKDSIRLSILGGLTLRIDSSSLLSDFLYSDSVDAKGPEGVPIEDFIIEVYYDGNTTQFYRYQESTFIRPDDGC